MKLNSTLRPVAYLLGLMVFNGALFFLATGLVDSFQKLLHYFNDPGSARPWQEWALFLSLSLQFGSIWSIVHLGAKICEQLFIKEFLPNNERKQKRTHRSKRLPTGGRKHLITISRRPRATLKKRMPSDKS